MESLFLDTQLNNSAPLLFGIMYRRPNTNINEYLNTLTDILVVIENESKKAIIGGDMNINLFDCQTNNAVLDYINLFRGRNFLSLINKPTRVTHYSCTLIDHIWSNSY